MGNTEQNKPSVPRGTKRTFIRQQLDANPDISNQELIANWNRAYPPVVLKTSVVKRERTLHSQLNARDDEYVIEYFEPSDFVIALLLILVPTTLFWCFDWRFLTEWYPLISTGIVLLTIVMAFAEANREANIVLPENRRLLLPAFFYWIPIAVCICPALMVILALDVAVEAGVAWAEYAAGDVLDRGDQALTEEIEQLEKETYRWWAIQDYVRKPFDEWKIEKLKQIRSGSVKKASIFASLFFTAIYFGMNIMHWVTWGAIIVLVLRSFLWVWVKVWLMNGGSVEFRLASENVR